MSPGQGGSGVKPGMVASTFIKEIGQLADYRLYGRVAGVLGMLVEVVGLEQALAIGSRCAIHAQGGRRVTCEVIGFRQRRALLLPFGSLEGVGLGCKAEVMRSEEHTSELQSLMRISYAVFCLKKQKEHHNN